MWPSTISVGTIASSEFSGAIFTRRVPFHSSDQKALGGLTCHVINRGVGRQTLFHKDYNYAALEQVMVRRSRLEVARTPVKQEQP